MTDKFDKYKCSICQDILNYPVTLKKCFHEFCLACMQSYVKTNLQNHKVLSCPLCRVEFKPYDYVIATDLQREIENCYIQCKCGQYIPIKKYEEHHNKCKNNNINKDGSVSGNYDCTLCSKKGMNREGYVNHIHECHYDAMGVCAICSVQPWGDKNYQTYLSGHVDLRHKKDIIYYEQNTKELELIKKVLEMSKSDK